MKHDTDLGQITKELETLSRIVFSKKHRLEIAALIGASEPPIWARQLARTLEIGENQAASELAEFEKLGALLVVPSEFDRRKLYMPVPHWLWTSAREALEERVRTLDPDDGDELVSTYWAFRLEGSDPRPVPARAQGS